MGNKTNMKQIVIILMGVLLIVSMVGGVLGEERTFGEGVFVDKDGKLYEDA